jgi:MGT family glycosyltransferase
MNDVPRTTYLFALVDGGGTVPPEIAAVRRLVARGHDVTVLAEDTMADEVRTAGAAFRPWVAAPNRPSRRAEDDPYRDWECKNPLQLFARILDRQLVGPAPRYATDVDAAIAAHRPDIVVCSMFAIGAMVAAESHGIAFDVMIPNVYPLPAPGLPAFGMGLKPARGVLGRTRDRAVTRLTGRLWTKGLAGVNALRTERGLAPLGSFWDQIHNAHRQIVLTSAAFDFPATMPANVRYVGPVLDDPAWAAPWSPPDGDAPLVLVGLSSTFQDHAPALQRIIDALATLPVRGLVTTGPTIDPATLRGAPNVDVVTSAPHAQVLAHAAAVVTHGGHGTVVKALAAGVPLVVLPHGRDQADNAVRVAQRGAGVQRKKGAGADAIAAAVRRVLEDPSFATNAALLGDALRRDAESDQLERALEDLPRAAATHERCA